MNLIFSDKTKKESVLIYPLFDETIALPVLTLALRELREAGVFSRKSGQTYFLHKFSKKLPHGVILLGLGKGKDATTASIMDAFGAATKAAAQHNPKHFALLLNEDLCSFCQSIAEAVTLANYQSAALYKTGKNREELNKNYIRTLDVIGIKTNSEAKKAFEKGVKIGSVANDVRDWVNAPPNYANTDFFIKKANEIKKETGSSLTILRKKDLEKLNMGAFLGVSRGADEEPGLIILEYTPKWSMRKDPPIVFVGKGIVFDSGGYNLKPRGHIEDMQLDKAGAASVLALLKLIHAFKINRRIIAVTPFAENLIGPKALKPSEILTTHSGKTVEITNTDGEGRLILADAISYAIEKFNPKYLIDMATLTGACMIALGDRYAGLFGNDDDLCKKLQAAGDEVDELLWPMPLHKDICEKMKGQYADLRNSDTGSSMYAGASKGAAFIKEFVGKTKWAHIDIAAPAFTSDPKKYESKGATGFGLRLALRFLEKLG